MHSSHSTAPRPRFLSEADCHDIAQRLDRYAKGGGYTAVKLVSRWIGNVRWARNRIISSGEDRDHHVNIRRGIRGAFTRNQVEINEISDAALIAAARRAERILELEPERPEGDVVMIPGSRARPLDEPVANPHLFFESTYQLNAEQRADAVHQCIQSAKEAGMHSAGYIEVSATSMAWISSWGEAKYYDFTWAHVSLTVRDPSGTGSGWAGVDWPDWSKITPTTLAATALEKCLNSRHVVAVEPGRYTTILEPQAVGDFIGLLTFDEFGYGSGHIGRDDTNGPTTTFGKIKGGEPFYQAPPGKDQDGQNIGMSRLGEKLIDERISISSDPMDPELGVPPFQNFYNADNPDAQVYHPVTWFENGVLKNLAYDREYAVHYLGKSTGLPNQGNMRMRVSGPTTSVQEMIATTQRGLYVTRFYNVTGPESAGTLCRGYTRDGIWLIENGKISKPVKNMVFVESIMGALNNVEQLGDPVRIFHPLPSGALFYVYANPQPLIVPPMKIRDFSFTALSDAI